MGYLLSHSELNCFNEIMNRARKLPNGFTEDMIMKNPVPEHHEQVGLLRVLSLYFLRQAPRRHFP